MFEIKNNEFKESNSKAYLLSISIELSSFEDMNFHEIKTMNEKPDFFGIFHWNRKFDQLSGTQTNKVFLIQIYVKYSTSFVIYFLTRNRNHGSLQC